MSGSWRGSEVRTSQVTQRERETSHSISTLARQPASCQLPRLPETDVENFIAKITVRQITW